jgi:hypothetical protein
MMGSEVRIFLSAPFSRLATLGPDAVIGRSLPIFPDRGRFPLARLHPPMLKYFGQFADGL